MRDRFGDELLLDVAKLGVVVVRSWADEGVGQFVPGDGDLRVDGLLGPRAHTRLFTHSASAVIGRSSSSDSSKAVTSAVDGCLIA